MRSTIKRWLASRIAETTQDDASYFERVYVVDAALEQMAVESESKPGVETGGVLVGFIDRRLCAAVITHASGPGPNALHRPDRFERDREFCQLFLDQHAVRTGGVLDFLGEWHKHREADPWPSPTDRNTYQKLAADPNCHLDQVVVLITGTRRLMRPTRDQFVGVNGFLFRSRDFVPRSVHGLTGEAYEDLLR